MRVPALAERREDIPGWSTISCERVGERPACRRRPLADDAMATLQGHDWPGNVRQLRNIVERLLILAPASGGPIAPRCCRRRRQRRARAALGAGGEIMSLPLREAREVFEREYLDAQISASTATSRAPPPSSAWSARPCTAS